MEDADLTCKIAHAVETCGACVISMCSVIELSKYTSRPL